jgi:hypothetical protein
MAPHRARLTLRDPILANSRSAPHFNRGATKLLPESLPSLGQQLLLRRGIAKTRLLIAFANAPNRPRSAAPAGGNNVSGIKSV